MDELILMEKMMEEMFAMDDVEQVEELDIKKGIVLLFVQTVSHFAVVFLHLWVFGISVSETVIHIEMEQF